MIGKFCLLFPLLLWRSSVLEAQPLYQLPSETLDFGFVPAKSYETNTHDEPGAIGIVFQVVRAFLNFVQPNHFPEGKRPTLNCSEACIISATLVLNLFICIKRLWFGVCEFSLVKMKSDILLFINIIHQFDLINFLYIFSPYTHFKM